MKRSYADWGNALKRAAPLSMRKLTPIGIDVDGRFLNAVQCVRRAGTLVIEAAATVVRHDAATQLQAADVKRLAGVLDRQGFSGSEVVLMMPARLQLTGVLELPPAGSGAPLGQLARMEMARMHRCEPDAMEMAWWHLPARRRAGETAPVMAAACRLDDANPVLDLFEAEGLRVRALDIAAWAMRRACRSLIDPKGSALLLNVGWERCSIVLVHQSVVVYERMLPEGALESLRDRLVQDLEINPAEADSYLSRAEPVAAAVESAPASDGSASGEARAIIEAHFENMVREIAVSSSYVSQQYDNVQFDQVLVAGAGATLEELSQQIEATLGMRARPIAPADVAECPSALMRLAANPALTLALGLADHAEKGPHVPDRSANGDPDAMQGVNLIPAARRSAAAHRRKLHRWSLAVAGYASFLVVLTLVLRVASAGAQHAVASESQETADTIARCRSEIATARNDLKALLPELQASQVIHGQPDWSILLDLIAESGGGDVVLRNLRLTPATDSTKVSESPERFLISVAGLGQSQAGVSAFVLRLERTGLLHEVKLLQSRREPFQDGEAVAFEIECWLAGSEPGKEASS